MKILKYLFRNSYKKKLMALMEGLEIQHIDAFINQAKTGDYRRLGELMQTRIKEILNNQR